MAVPNEQISNNRNIENTILMETNNFVVIPALGPIMVGHVLIVSRKHYLNIATMGKEALIEYEKIREYLSNYEPYNSIGFLEFEHGVTEHDDAGACISHAHSHWMPNIDNIIPTLEGILNPLKDIKSIVDLNDINIPYIFIRDTNTEGRFFDAYRVESQLIRQLICEKLGREDWDWSSNPHYDWIKETISLWKGNKSERF